MNLCPECYCELKRTKDTAGIVWLCPRCGGRASSLAVLGKTLSDDLVRQLWRIAKEEKLPSDRICPLRNEPMVRANHPKTPGTMLCPRCRIAWFNAQEFAEQAAHPKEHAASHKADPRAEQAIAAFEAASRKHIDRVKWLGRVSGLDQELQEPPDAWWKLVLAFLGVPVKVETEEFTHRPWLTWTLILTVSAISIACFSNWEIIFEKYGLIPAQALRYHGLTFLTCFFLHAGYLHLIGNMYYLLVFGDSVEDFLGRLKYVALILLATVAAGAVHVMYNPASQEPCVGASGGISGVLTFYMLQFPKARLGFFWYWRWFQIPAWIALFIWFIYQFFVAWLQVMELINVSALAHLGGAAMGILLWIIYRIFAAYRAKVSSTSSRLPTQ